MVNFQRETISNPDWLYSSETGVNPRIRSWKNPYLNELQFQKVIGDIYFTKKSKVETLPPGLEFDNFKPPPISCIFKCIFLLNGLFLESGSQDLPSGGLTLSVRAQKWGLPWKVQRRHLADIFPNESLPPKPPLWTPCPWPPWPRFSCEKSLKIFEVLWKIRNFERHFKNLDLAGKWI